ncbi:MAG: response regulator [Planctomycetes bacterium]|nr:response regulator [Planctomycetota bacterium]
MNALIPINVLVAEPDRAARETLAEMLAGEGANVHFAETGRSAMEIAQRVTIHAGVIDASLADMTGLQLLARLRAVLHGPVLFVGATASKEVRMQAVDAGAWSWLPRPFEKEIARLTIHGFVIRFSQGE